MTGFRDPMRPRVAMPVKARAPQDVPVDRARCWVCDEEWPAGQLTSGGAGPCCVLTPDEYTPAA